MLMWLIPVGLFWYTAALYLGGMAVEVVGGNGLRQVGGLISTFVLYLVAWRVLGMALGNVSAVLGGVILPSVIATFALPLLARAGFGIMGVRVKRGHHAAH